MSQTYRDGERGFYNLCKPELKYTPLNQAGDFQSLAPATWTSTMLPVRSLKILWGSCYRAVPWPQSSMHCGPRDRTGTGVSCI